jgi:polysaccharide biosynthesis protein PelF
MTADVCLFVEGTYPYVTGGVSSWLHQLIEHLPDFTFAVVYLGSQQEPDRTPRYQLPRNVVEFQEVYLNVTVSPRAGMRFRHSANRWKQLAVLHNAFTEDCCTETVEMLRQVDSPGRDRLETPDLIYSHEAWEMLVKQYREAWANAPFLDYFWTFRSTHLPLFVLHDAHFPQARLYHTVSTGYAGYAASLASQKTGSPLIITEHGIYTREREIEIMLSAWQGGSPNDKRDGDQHVGAFKDWWVRMFRFMSCLTYERSRAIISITQVNQQYQVRDGADPSKLKLIPNGIDINRFRNIERHVEGSEHGFTVGFIGRIVPIKDVKTFLQAIQIAQAEIPDLKALIIGPLDEEPDYVAECRDLAASLQITRVIEFTGSVDVTHYYGRLDVLVLTSLSEAQPLVILEANCAGIPVVATDVGACRELLEGITPDDRGLGPGGLITPPASPDDTAQAIVQMWKDKMLRTRLGEAGKERVTRFYQEEAVYTAYRELYCQLARPAPGLGDSELHWQV